MYVFTFIGVFMYIYRIYIHQNTYTRCDQIKRKIPLMEGYIKITDTIYQKRIYSVYWPYNMYVGGDYLLVCQLYDNNITG